MRSLSRIDQIIAPDQAIYRAPKSVTQLYPHLKNPAKFSVPQNYLS